MQLQVDGKQITAKTGQTLLDLIKELGLQGGSLRDRPIAAKIAGEIFNLNYVPVRQNPEGTERSSIRRAMAASGGVINLLRYADPAGRDVYGRTAQFVLFLAIRQVWPEAKAKMNCTVGPALYIEVQGVKDFCAETLKQQVQSIVEADIPLIRWRTTTRDAVSIFEQRGRQDKADLLKWRQAPYYDMYGDRDHADYYFGELAPSTGYLSVWDIVPERDGFMFIYPDDHDPDRVAHYEQMPNFLEVSTEAEHWCRLMECENVADLNKLVESGRIRELIRVNEALHEKNYARVADMICQRGAQVVMLAGPSSSGKTTSANRLATQLRVFGKKPVLMSLDDYYVDRDKIQPGPDGKLDLEHINTIDTVLFRQHLTELLDRKPVEIPTFDFISGKRVWAGHVMELTERTVIIVEGLHGLNPALLPERVDHNRVFRLYVSPLLPLNLDDHNRIPTSLLRLLRRIVRDYENRGSSVEKTMSMWDSVRRGEKRWIFPFQENADVIFNSSTLYELSVLKKHIFPLLQAVGPEQSCYDDVRALVRVLNYVLEAEVDDEIPPTSLVREFIGGNTFYR